MPKKGAKTERERARLAVIPTLYELYCSTGLMTEQCVDMIAKQCDYHMDACIATLSEMVSEPRHGATAPTSQPASQHTRAAAPVISNAPVVLMPTGSAPKPAAAATSAWALAPPSSASAAAAAHPAASAPAPAPAPSAADPAPSNPKKKGILFLSPRPSSELNRPQPVSVWKSAGNAKRPPAAKPWSKAAPESKQPPPQEEQNEKYEYKGALSLSRTPSEAAAVKEPSAEDDGYGSDSNLPADVALLRRCTPAQSMGNAAAAVAAYTYTGFETQPYWDLAPRLLDALPPRILVPAGNNAVLDPAAPSSGQLYSEGKDGDGDVHASSPAHPAHHLHALYLQLNSDQTPAPAPAKASWQQFAGGASAAPPPSVPSIPELSEEDLSSLTPAQALAFQQRQHALARAAKKDFTGWMKQHEQQKKLVKARGAQTAVDPREEEAKEREEREIAEALAAVAEAEAQELEAELAGLSMSPTDIPSLPPLSRAEQRHSQETIVSSPQRLVAFLVDLFNGELDESIIRAVVESTVSAAPVPELRGSGAAQRAKGSLRSEEEEFQYRDLAQECCTTLLAILEEERERSWAEEDDAEFASDMQQQLQQQQAPHAHFRGGRASRKAQQEEAAVMSAASTPFVASALQMSDADIAARMAIDPDFDPNALSCAPDPQALAQATQASTPTAPVQRNKRGHIKVDRAAPSNAWAAQTATGAAVAPDLSAQWSLTALFNSFPLADREVVEQTFQANGHSFARAREHLAQLYPGAMMNPHARPAPVHTPWAQSSKHHSKVQSTSSTDARRGVITEAPQQQGYAVAGDGAEAGLSDAALEEAIGPLLDNRAPAPAAAAAAAVSPFTSSDSLRALADVHARRRAAYFGAAASAFSRGQGGVAADLAARGRAEKGQLERAQSAAMLATFVAHNAQGHHGHSGSNSGAKGHARQGEVLTLDFHGLRVAEALRVLHFVLARVHKGRGGKGGTKELHLITGVGHHSQQGRARLTPALRDYLRQHGYSCNASNPGVLSVSLSR